jgi:8-oxo-dGTP diphosphatase
VPTPDYVLDLRRSFGSGRLLLPAVVAVVVRDDPSCDSRRQVLLTRRSDNGLWALPAGILEPDEQPGAAMLRELAEETRVVARLDRLALVTTDPDVIYPNGDVCQFLTLTFAGRYLSGEAQVGDAESTAVDWFALDELPAELSAIQLRRISCALDSAGECVFDS